MTRFYQVGSSWFVSNKSLSLILYSWPFWNLLVSSNVYQDSKSIKPTHNVHEHKLASSCFSWFEVHKGKSSHLCCLMWMINSILIIFLFYDQQPMNILKCFYYPKWLHKTQRSLVSNKLHLRFRCYHPSWL